MRRRNKKKLKQENPDGSLAEAWRWEMAHGFSTAVWQSFKMLGEFVTEDLLWVMISEKGIFGKIFKTFFFRKIF